MFDGVGRRRDAEEGRLVDIGQASLNGRERNVLFRNDGDGTFTDVGWPNGADRVEDGRGLSILDVDGDGTLDLLLRNYLQPAVLLRNRGAPGNWIALRLVGTASNRDAVGARVRVRTGERWQVREVAAGSGFLSSHSRVQHFGLGEHESADEIVVHWPSGASTRLEALAAGARYRLVEGESRATIVRMKPVRAGADDGGEPVTGSRRDRPVVARAPARVPRERDSAIVP